MSAGGWNKLLATGWINIIDYISKRPWKFDVTVTLKLAIKNVLSGKIEFELSSVIQEDCPPWVGIFQSLQLLIFVKWIYLLQYSSLDILILGRENNDLLLKELQEEKPLLKIKGDPENFQGVQIVREHGKYFAPNCFSVSLYTLPLPSGIFLSPTV